MVVSGDVGYVKPHPRPFETAIKMLDLPPNEIVFVGDNWLADIQGAKRAGMQAIWSRQFATPEKFEPKPGDIEPNAQIDHLTELETLL